MLNWMVPFCGRAPLVPNGSVVVLAIAIPVSNVPSEMTNGIRKVVCAPAMTITVRAGDGNGVFAYLGTCPAVVEVSTAPPELRAAPVGASVAVIVMLPTGNGIVAEEPTVIPEQLKFTVSI